MGRFRARLGRARGPSERAHPTSCAATSLRPVGAWSLRVRFHRSPAMACDNAADAEDHDSRAFGPARGVETAGTAAVQVLDLDYASAPSAGGVGAESLRAWKGGNIPGRCAGDRQREERGG